MVCVFGFSPAVLSPVRYSASLSLSLSLSLSPASSATTVMMRDLRHTDDEGDHGDHDYDEAVERGTWRGRKKRGRLVCGISSRSRIFNVFMAEHGKNDPLLLLLS